MAQNIAIFVETELGDTLLKMELAKRAIKDVGDESEETAAKQDAAAASTTFFSGMLSELGGSASAGTPLLASFGSTIFSFGVFATAASVAAVALADAVGTIIAIFAAFVAPLTLVTGLLGSLGAGFLFAAKSAFGGGGALHGALGRLKDQFGKLTDTLAGRFMPIFKTLIGDASDALDFLTRIAKLPLDQAFKQLATQGVPAVKHFFDYVGGLLSKPIRLAFQIAFGQGKGGNEIASAVSQMWTEFTNYLFGYTKTHVIRLDGRVFEIDQKHVAGIFQPLITWFNSHSFTKEGTRIGHQILNGLKPLTGPIGQFLVHVFVDGMKTAVGGMLRAINPFSEGTKQKVRALNDWIEHALVSVAQSAWGKIKSLAGSAIQSIANHFGSLKATINTVVGIAHRFIGVLQQIAGFFSRVFTLHVDWPSPPSWLNSVIGGAGSVIGSIPHAVGSVANVGRTGMGGHVAMGGNVTVVNHWHSVDLSTPEQRRRVAHDIGNEIFRQANRHN